MPQTQSNPISVPTKWLPEIPIADIDLVLFGIVADILTFHRHALAADNEDELWGIHWGLHCIFIHANNIPSEHVTQVPTVQVLDWAHRVNMSRAN